MENESIQGSLRDSRSRSRTPFLRSSSDRESLGSEHQDTDISALPSAMSIKQQNLSHKKSNLVSISETHSSEVTLSHTRKRLEKGDQESKPELRSAGEQKIGRRSERQRMKRKVLVNGATTKDKKEVSSTQVQTRTKKQIVNTSDYSSEEGEGSSLTAYEVYKQAGDWWNVFPKTDYTYSTKSCDRKEISPGVILMPNMSRPSIRPVRSDKMDHVYSTRHVSAQQTERKSRVFYPAESGSRLPPAYQDWIPDSDVDEVDESVTVRLAHQHWSLSDSFSSMFTAVWLFLSSMYTKTISYLPWTGHTSNFSPRRTGSLAEQGFLGRWANRIFEWIYLVVAHTMVLDGWLLSRLGTTTPTEESTDSEMGGSRRKWLLLLIVPLILLAGCYWVYSEDVSDSEKSGISMFNRTLGILGGWLLAPFSSSEDLDNMTEDTPYVAQIPKLEISGTGEGIDMAILVQKIVENDQFQKLINSHQHISQSELLKALEQTSSQSELLEEFSLRQSQLVQTLTEENKQVLLQLISEVASVKQQQASFESRVDDSEKEKDDIRDENELVLQLLLEMDHVKEHVDNMEEQSSGTKNEILQLRLEMENIKLGANSPATDNSQELLHSSSELGSIKEKVDELSARIYASEERHRIQSEIDDGVKEDSRESRLFVLKSELQRLQEQIKLLQERQLQLSHNMIRCCRHPRVSVEEQVTRFLSQIFGREDYVVDRNATNIREWIKNVLVGKDELEAKLSNLTTTMKLDLNEVAEESARTIMYTVSDKIGAEFAKRSAPAANGSNMMRVANGTIALTDAQVKAIVDEVLAVYDADKTGMVDYALESSGGSVVSTRCTESYQSKTAILTILGIPMWYPANNPRVAIQPGVHPGECWAFRGSQGHLVIGLSGKVRISALSLEHIPRSIAPAGNIDSAPKDFSVLGLREEEDVKPVQLGKFVYIDNGTSLQYFPLQRQVLEAFSMVELHIESNHGNLNYTCLYRFRVHGVLT